MHIEPYLFFEGRCAEAVEFYRDALGAEVTMLMRYKDSPEPAPPGKLPAGSEDKVMHASLRIGDTTVMASDGLWGRRAFRASPCRSQSLTRGEPTQCSRPSPTVGRCKCRSARRSGRPGSAWSPIASGSDG